MKKIISISLGLMIVLVVQGQKNKHNKIEDNEVYFLVEEMPQFHYGDCEPYNEYCFKKYLIEKIKHSNLSHCSGIFFTQFDVDKNGKVINAKLVRELNGCTEYSDEILKLINESPLWIPGKNRNKTVKVRLTIRIRLAPNEE